MSTKHRLDPLLRPATVAVVGASSREHSMGAWALRNLARGGFAGELYPVNPAYEELAGKTCFAKLADLPRTPDLVIFALGDQRIEQALDEAIDMAVPAAVLMSSLYLDDDDDPPLKKRVADKIRRAGMLVCGANGMGFYNVRDRTWACGFDSRLHEAPGNASLISHSGSGMCGIIDCDARLRINLAVSAGNELSVTMDQYLDFALELPETKVVGLFIETARNPRGFAAALQKAAAKNIPIVALKVGRTRKSALLTVSHSGALAGDDDTYDALFDRYGVHRVGDMDELATAMIVFAELNPIGPGGLVTLHDSGGERQLLVDLADDAGVPLTDLDSETVRALEKVLDPELPAVNPLDAWSRGGAGARAQMTECLAIMMQDPGAAIGAVIHDRAPDGFIYSGYLRYMQAAREASGKPVALVSARQGTGSDPQVVAATHAGYPVLDGVVPFLRSVRGLMNFRDFQLRPALQLPAAPAEACRQWLPRLGSGAALDEATSLAMLRDFGINASETLLAESESELLAACRSLKFPLVLKTAAAGAKHKTELRGVFLAQQDEQELVASYRNMAERLGPRALLASMAPAGIEMILGARRDPQFGPVIMFGFGGVLAELHKDIVFALPPFDAPYARRRLDELRMRPLLDGIRGNAAADVDAFCATAQAFSVMVDALRDNITELDINPVIVGSSGCIAVDALLVGRNNSEANEDNE
jgi:acyl-CoA synthetase (NDP forming)